MQKREPGSSLIGDVRQDAQREQSADAIRDQLKVLTEEQIGVKIWEQLRDVTGIDCTTWDGRERLKRIIARAEARQNFWGAIWGSAAAKIAGFIFSLAATIFGTLWTSWWVSGKK